MPAFIFRNRIYELYYCLFNGSPFLWLLFIVNIAGTVYGYYWYIPQLDVTPLIFIPFVPDSPTASLFFVFALIAFLRNKNYPLIEALALITLVKYGVWAVVMNILTLKVTGYLPWQGYMLIASHGAMAVKVFFLPNFISLNFGMSLRLVHGRFIMM